MEDTTYDCHIFMNKKGGVGKTFGATLLAQHLNVKPDAELYCADTDPIVPMFFQHRALRVEHINISRPDFSIDRTQFDHLIERLEKHEGNCVLDTGSSSFLAFISYVKENDLVEYLLEMGRKRVVLHVPLVAGASMSMCVEGMELLLQHTEASIVIWENGLYGDVQHNGVALRNAKLFKDYADRILGVVTLPVPTDTVMFTLGKMVQQRLTFVEAMERKDIFKGVELLRLDRYAQLVRGQLEAVGL